VEIKKKKLRLLRSAFFRGTTSSHPSRFILEWHRLGLLLVWRWICLYQQEISYTFL